MPCIKCLSGTSQGRGLGISGRLGSFAFELLNVFDFQIKFLRFAQKKRVVPIMVLNKWLNKWLSGSPPKSYSKATDRLTRASLLSHFAGQKVTLGLLLSHFRDRPWNSLLGSPFPTFWAASNCLAWGVLIVARMTGAYMGKTNLPTGQLPHLTNEGTEKAHKLLQHKLFGPHPKHPIFGPQRKVYVPHFLGKDAKKGPT